MGAYSRLVAYYTFSAFIMDAYSRWALILGWALIRINTVVCKFLVQSFCKYLHYNIFLFSYIFYHFLLASLICSAEGANPV